MKKRFKNKNSRFYMMIGLIKNGSARCPICNKKLAKFIFNNCRRIDEHDYNPTSQNGYICDDGCIDIQFNINEFEYAEFYYRNEYGFFAGIRNDCIEVRESDYSYPKKPALFSLPIGTSIIDIIKIYEEKINLYKYLS